MPRHAHPLRAEFEAAVLAHAKLHGDDFERSALVQSYIDRGVGQATAYRWLAAVLATGHVSRDHAKAKPTAAPRGVARPPLISATLPAVPHFEDVAKLGVVPVVALLNAAIDAASNVIAHARNPEGGVRNARLMLVGADHLRRAVETAAKLNEAIGQKQAIERFHAILLEEIAREPREVQERIYARIRRASDAVLAGR